MERSEKALCTYWYRILSVGLLLAGVLLVGTTLSPHLAQTHAAYNGAVASQVRDFYIPPMTIGGGTYTVSADGAVEKGDGGRPAARTQARALGLAHYALVHRLDPVFALEGTDPQQLAQAARALEDQVRSIAADYPFSEARLIVQSLYPTELLQELAELEEVRQHLLASPSEKTAVTYHERLVAAFDAYERAVQQHQSALDSIAIESDNYDYYTLDGSVTLPYFKQAVAQMETGVAANRAREAARWQCYHGDAVACERPRDAFQKLTDIPPAASFEPTHTEPKIPGKEQVIAATRINPQDGAVAPYVVEQRNACLPGIETVVQVPVWIQAGGGDAFTVLYGDDVYLFDFSKIEEGPLYTGPFDIGVQRKFQGIFNFYTCRHSLETMADIRTDLALRSASGGPVTALYEISPQLDALHENLSSKESIHAPHVDAYTHELGALLEQTGERAFIERFGVPALLQTEQILNMFTGRSAATDELVRRVIDDNGAVSRRNSIGPVPIPIRDLFISRSAPFFFFFAHNKSILAYSLPPVQHDEPPSPDDFRWLVSYQQTLRETHTPEEIITEALKGRIAYQAYFDSYGTQNNFSLPFTQLIAEFIW